jgi:hypothetical protein
MLHPHTELRFVTPLIGYGVFATNPIPRGTITWVRDPLDQAFSPAQVAAFPPMQQQVLERYSFVDAQGDSILCWDHGRYVNHACEANCLGPGYGFEIAIRDIAPGEELTDDYGSLNVDVPFDCLCGSPRCRRQIRPDDLLIHGEQWDALIGEAFARLESCAQPLWALLHNPEEVRRAARGEIAIPSCRDNHFGARPLVRCG